MLDHNSFIYSKGIFSLQIVFRLPGHIFLFVKTLPLDPEPWKALQDVSNLNEEEVVALVRTSLIKWPLIASTMNLPIVSIKEFNRASGLPTRLHRVWALHCGRCICSRHTRPGRILLCLQNWLAGYCSSITYADLIQSNAPFRLLIERYPLISTQLQGKFNCQVKTLIQSKDNMLLHVRQQQSLYCCL